MKKFRIGMSIIKKDDPTPKKVSLTVEAGNAKLAVTRAIREARNSSLAPKDHYIMVQEVTEVM